MPVLMLTLFLSLASFLPAQLPRQFDVVSIKPSAPDEHDSFMFQSLPGGTLRLAGVPLRMMIMEAYGVKVFQISGGPDWIRTDRWDVLAKAERAEGRIPRPDENALMQAMMADRFQLKIHTETKEMSVYGLVVEKNGSKLVTSVAAQQQSRTGNGSLTVKKGRIGGAGGLVSWLSRTLGRVVVDETNLTGLYDYSLEWSPDPGEGGAESTGLPPEPPRPRVETNGPSIFTALQEQLGLRLVSRKGSVEMLVIDSVEKPSAN